MTIDQGRSERGGEGGVSPSNKLQKQGAIAMLRVPDIALKTSIIFW